MFLLALMVMLAEERRETVGMLRLLGFSRTTHPAAGDRGRRADRGGRRRRSASSSPSRSQVRSTASFNGATTRRWCSCGSRRVACSRSLLAVPLGVAASVIASWTLLRQQILAPGSGDERHVSRISLRVAQPRAAAGALAARHRGVAAIGALLFDMLLLSRGLVVSFGDLLDRSGFDVRVLASDAPLSPDRGCPMRALANEIAACRGSRRCLPLRVRDAAWSANRTVPALPPGTRSCRQLDPIGESGGHVHFIGADPRCRSMWTVVEGRDVPDTVGSVSRGGRQRAARQTARPSGRIDRVAARPLHVTRPMRCRRCAFTVAGIAEFPFDSSHRCDRGWNARRTCDRLCGGRDRRRAEMLLVGRAASRRAGAPRPRSAPRHPDLYVVTNDELVERFSRVEFSYFRQISTVLAIVTLFFGFLLITVLLTVSVNQRLGEIAALRALGFSRSRMVADVLWESALLVGIGGLLALPLGGALSRVARRDPAHVARHAGAICTSSSSSRARCCCTSPARRSPARRRGLSDVDRRRLPIAGTLRREVVS